MELHIGPKKQISEVQSEFNNAFPFLKLEFYQPSSVRNSASQPRIKVQPGKRFEDIPGVSTDGFVEITPEMIVGDLEKMLKLRFKMDVQVFRRSGILWLQTTMTDTWTLQKQNQHGSELSHSTRLISDNNEDGQ